MNHFPTSTTPLLVFLVAACGDGTGPGDGCEPADLVLPATASGVLAISNVFVLPMDGTGLLEGQTVVVRGDRIERVGPAAQVVVPSEAVVIDGTCRLVMPGMADMHVHMGWKADAILLLANGVTTAREMWGSTAHLDFRNEILAGGHPGPSLSVGSAGIRSTEFMESIEILDPADAAGVVNRLADVGYDFIKVHEDIRSAVYDAVIAAADARGIAVAGHAGLNLTVTQVLGGSQTSIEHIATAFSIGIADHRGIGSRVVRPATRSIQCRRPGQPARGRWCMGHSHTRYAPQVVHSTGGVGVQRLAGGAVSGSQQNSVMARPGTLGTILPT